MTALILVLLVLFVVCLIGYMVYVSSKPDWSEPVEPPPSEAELLQARLDLHRVESGVDLALAKHEIHQEGSRIKQAIADALDDQR